MNLEIKRGEKVMVQGYDSKQSRRRNFFSRYKIVKAAYIFLLLLGTGFCREVVAQTYPVQVNTHLLSPYSAYLSDYYTGTRERLTVTLINRDQFQPTLQVRLRMTITATGGVTLQTNPNAYIEPIQLDNGAPLRLTLDDLTPYFLSDNLIVSGVLTDGKLPEGMVTFCFQAIEAYTGQVLSTSACATAWITAQQPPLLSLPLNEESVAWRDPLNLLFQWTPRHQGLALVEYEFILKELWDTGMTPQAEFPYATEVYRETTRSTSLAYGAIQPTLTAGKRYAWCIRAQARDGVDELNLFQNEGYSEVRWFSLQDDCAPPSYVEAVPEKNRLSLTWDTSPEYIGFTIDYRIQSDDDTQNEWTQQETLTNEAILYSLEGGNVYEFRVASECITGNPVYTDIMTAEIPAVDSARLAQCGIMGDVDLDNQESIESLVAGDVIIAGDFPMTITTISEAGGLFTGEGWTILPWLNDAKIAVEFKNIKVNTDKQLIAGYIEAQYDKTESQIADLDEVFEGGKDVGIVKTGLADIDTIFNFSIPGVDAFDLDLDGNLVITDSEGTTHTIDTSVPDGEEDSVFPMVVQDKDGNIYQVVKETDPITGEESVVATKIGSAGTALSDGSFDPDQLDSDKAVVSFSQPEDGNDHYPLDFWQSYYKKIALIGPKYDQLDTDYYAPWKFLPSGGSDIVKATIEIADTLVHADKVIFITPTGTQYDYTLDGTTYTLNLIAGPAGDAQEIYALYPKSSDGSSGYYTLGKLDVATYAVQSHKVVLVPVAGAPVDQAAIQAALTQAYGPIAITWQVEKATNFNYDGEQQLMANSTGLSTYNDEMKALNDAYITSIGSAYDASANYLFFLKATGSETINDRDITGFMPRGAQFGYLFTSEIKESYVPAAVAHELGHGRWKLVHPFDANYGGLKEAKETNNLMAYGNGLMLAKWQWDIINDPAMLVSLFESDAESESNLPIYFVNDMVWILLNEAENLNTGDSVAYYTYLTPSGHPITLSMLTQPSFTGTTGNIWVDNLVPKGSLIAFKEGNNIYGAMFDKIDNELVFKGYRSKADATVYYDGDFYSRALPASYSAVIGVEDADACMLYIRQGTSKTPYQAISPDAPAVVSGSLHLANIKQLDTGIEITKCLPPLGITYQELLTETQVIVGAYGGRGMLYTFKDAGKQRYVYAGLHDDGTQYLME